MPAKPGARSSELGIRKDSHSPCPARGRAFYFHRETADLEAIGGKCFQLVEFFHLKVADFAPGLVSFPDNSRVF